MRKIYTTGWSDYELIDAGGGKKLERWGKIITIRPELQAYFRSEKPFDEWNQLAHWEFIPKGAQSGTWKQLKEGAPKEPRIYVSIKANQIQTCWAFSRTTRELGFYS
jgi:23S rRNA (cytosine1962-C5)-methyltransferase